MSIKRHCSHCNVYLNQNEIEDGQFCSFCGTFAPFVAVRGSKEAAEKAAITATLFTHTGFYTVDVPEHKDGWLILEADTLDEALPEIERRLDANIVEKHSGEAYAVHLLMQPC